MSTQKVRRPAASAVNTPTRTIVVSLVAVDSTSALAIVDAFLDEQQERLARGAAVNGAEGMALVLTEVATAISQVKRILRDLRGLPPMGLEERKRTREEDLVAGADAGEDPEATGEAAAKAEEDKDESSAQSSSESSSESESESESGSGSESESSPGKAESKESTEEPSTEETPRKRHKKSK